MGQQGTMVVDYWLPWSKISPKNKRPKGLNPFVLQGVQLVPAPWRWASGSTLSGVPSNTWMFSSGAQVPAKDPGCRRTMLGWLSGQSFLNFWPVKGRHVSEQTHSCPLSGMSRLARHGQQTTAATITEQDSSDRLVPRIGMVDSCWMIASEMQTW